MGWSVCVDPIPRSRGQGGSVAHCGNQDLEICIPTCNLESSVIGGYMCVNAMWVGGSRCVVSSTTTPEKEILRDARTGCDNESWVGRARCITSRTATIHPTDATTSKCSNLTLLSFKTCNKAPLPTIERGSIADYNAYDNCYQAALAELDRCMGLTSTVSRDDIAPPWEYPASSPRIEYDDDAILRNEDASDACDRVSLETMTACHASRNTTSADDGGTSTNEGLEYDVCYNVSMAARDRCIELRKTMQPVTPRGVIEPASRHVRNIRRENGSTTIIIVNQRNDDDDDDDYNDYNNDHRNRGTSWAVILSIIIPVLLLSMCCVYLYIPLQRNPDTHLTPSL